MCRLSGWAKGVRYSEQREPCEQRARGLKVRASLSGFSLGSKGKAMDWPHRDGSGLQDSPQERAVPEHTVGGSPPREDVLPVLLARRDGTTCSFTHPLILRTLVHSQPLFFFNVFIF